jgi:hypothetical protein
MGEHLCKGQRFRFHGATWRVVYVNASRAHVVTHVTTTVQIGPRAFNARRERAMDISPTTDVGLLQELQP